MAIRSSFGSLPRSEWQSLGCEAKAPAEMAPRFQSIPSGDETRELRKDRIPTRPPAACKPWRSGRQKRRVRQPSAKMPRAMGLVLRLACDVAVVVHQEVVQRQHACLRHLIRIAFSPSEDGHVDLPAVLSDWRRERDPVAIQKRGTSGLRLRSVARV